MSHFTYHSALAPAGQAPVWIKESVTGHRYLFNPQIGSYQSIDIGQIVKTAGPLVVQYLVPFIKELVAALNASKNAPVPTPAPAALWFY